MTIHRKGKKKMNNKLDKRRKYYFVLDCETATLPYAHEFTGEDRKAIAIAKPLIYDLGWKIIDDKGKVYRRKAYLISEIFSVPQIFNTAYYSSKRPIYIDKLNKGEIDLTSWKNATAEMVKDMDEVAAVGAYNSMFDYKKAIKFTEEYITNLYSDNYYQWEEEQKRRIDYILSNPKTDNDREFNPDIFEFRGKTYPLFDIWGLSCENLLNNDEYRAYCKDNNLTTASGKYYPTNAEVAYRFVKGQDNFVESHTAIEDADIECEILAEVFKKVKPKNMTMGIIYFPFRILGRADTE
jgi:hypothetical protein